MEEVIKHIPHIEIFLAVIMLQQFLIIAFLKDISQGVHKK